MDRLPFDASKARGGDPDRASGANGPKPLTVSQAADLIRSTLERHTPSPLRVVGEVSNLTTSNHWYFSLKDDDAVLKCVAWATAVKGFAFVPKVGDEVVASGHLSHYPPQGQTQFYVKELQPVGAGALELRFRAMCEELRALGYFEESRKKRIPLFPRRIAVITAASGAAIHDVISTAQQRCGAVGILIVDVRVQGAEAARGIARAIRWVDRHRERLAVDAMLVTRGGGSMEDLWPFNERIVADAAFTCELPLVAAIGHESDTTVIELVADLRAATPTQAAMRLVPDGRELAAQLGHHQHRLRFLMRRLVEQQRHRLTAIERCDLFRDPHAILQLHRRRVDQHADTLRRVMRQQIGHERLRIERAAAALVRLLPQRLSEDHRQRIAALEQRLHRAVMRRVDRRASVAAIEKRLHATARMRLVREHRRFGAVQRHLAAVDPLAVLGRGYSYTTLRDGALIRSVSDVKAGQQVTTHVADGSFDSTVNYQPEQARRGRPSAPERPDQMDLFKGSQ